jgi:hypothetical protein
VHGKETAIRTILEELLRKPLREPTKSNMQDSMDFSEYEINSAVINRAEQNP